MNLSRLAFWKKARPRGRGKSRSRPEALRCLLRKVSILSKQKGYCYATNAYFSRESGSLLSGKHPKTIMRYIRDLRTLGYLNVLVYQNGTRHMTLTAEGRAFLGLTPEQKATPQEQNAPDLGQNAPAYVLSQNDPEIINNKKETSVRTTEILPQRSILSGYDEITAAQYDLVSQGICISRSWPRTEVAA